MSTCSRTAGFDDTWAPTAAPSSTTITADGRFRGDDLDLFIERGLVCDHGRAVRRWTTESVNRRPVFVHRRPSIIEGRCMFKWLLSAGLAALTAASPAAAQWPPYPRRGVPRTADGRVDLSAPTPRTPDGRPDLTGVWENVWFYNGKISPPLPSPPGEPPPSTFANIGAGFTNGLPLRPWAAELLRSRKEQNSKDNPDAHCLPMGLMQFHEHPQPRKIVQTPDLIVILYEGNSGIRQIFTDGRPLPGGSTTARCGSTSPSTIPRRTPSRSPFASTSASCPTAS
jgi:hypothetical protein